jgi:hypothetical protein
MLTQFAADAINRPAVSLASSSLAGRFCYVAVVASEVGVVAAHFVPP